MSAEYTLPGLGRFLQLSSESAALQSQLQNQDLKAGGPLGAASRDSMSVQQRSFSLHCMTAFHLIIVLFFLSVGFLPDGFSNMDVGLKEFLTEHVL